MRVRLRWLTMRRMKRHRDYWVLVALAALAVTLAALGIAGIGSESPVTNTASPRMVALRLVAKAAVLSGAPQGATCRRVPAGDRPRHYTCSGIICQVTLDVAKRHGGVADFYYCYPEPIECSPTGYCPMQPSETCVVGHGRTLTFNLERTNALPNNTPVGGPPAPGPSCPYEDEHYEP
jgi:hypothetical protein